MALLKQTQNLGTSFKWWDSRELWGQLSEWVSRPRLDYQLPFHLKLKNTNLATLSQKVGSVRLFAIKLSRWGCVNNLSRRGCEILQRLARFGEGLFEYYKHYLICLWGVILSFYPLYFIYCFITSTFSPFFTKWLIKKI